eukprot:9504153-Pyramimonas_sp.AAC.2
MKPLRNARIFPAAAKHADVRGEVRVLLAEWGEHDELGTLRCEDKLVILALAAGLKPPNGRRKRLPVSNDRGEPGRSVVLPLFLSCVPLELIEKRLGELRRRLSGCLAHVIQTATIPEGAAVEDLIPLQEITLRQFAGREPERRLLCSFFESFPVERLQVAGLVNLLLLLGENQPCLPIVIALPRGIHAFPTPAMQPDDVFGLQPALAVCLPDLGQLNEFLHILLTPLHGFAAFVLVEAWGDLLTHVYERPRHQALARCVRAKFAPERPRSVQMLRRNRVPGYVGQQRDTLSVDTPPPREFVQMPHLLRDGFGRYRASFESVQIGINVSTNHAPRGAFCFPDKAKHHETDGDVGRANGRVPHFRASHVADSPEETPYTIAIVAKFIHRLTNSCLQSAQVLGHPGISEQHLHHCARWETGRSSRHHEVKFVRTEPLHASQVKVLRVGAVQHVLGESAQPAKYCSDAHLASPGCSMPPGGSQPNRFPDTELPGAWNAVALPPLCANRKTFAA